ncbi:MAG: hypothetical protein ACLVL7_05320 [Anaerotruncus massiliensis (ex Togo et al. 2019)]
MEVIMQMGNELLVNLLVGVLSVLAALAICGVQKGIVYLKQQTAQLKDDGLRATLDSALEDVGRLAEVTVGSIEQTTAGVLRDAVKLGNANREDLVALSKKAFDEIKAAVTPEAQEIITRQLGIRRLPRKADRGHRPQNQNESPYLTLSNELLGDIVIDDGKARRQAPQHKGAFYGRRNSPQSWSSGLAALHARRRALTTSSSVCSGRSRKRTGRTPNASRRSTRKRRADRKGRGSSTTSSRPPLLYVTRRTTSEL